MKTMTLKKDNELKKELWNQGHSFRAVSGVCCPVLHLSIPFKCFGLLLNRLWWTTLSAKDLCLTMHWEFKPAETENFKKEKAFVSLFKVSLNQKIHPPPPLHIPRRFCYLFSIYQSSFSRQTYWYQSIFSLFWLKTLSMEWLSPKTSQHHLVEAQNCR